MAILPNSDIQQIQFCEDHIDVWTTNATAIGLTTAQVSALSSATNKARGSYNTAQTVRLASKAATANFHGDTGEMRENVRDLITLIKAKAETTNNPSVYTLAQIPPPAAPSPLPVPSAPTDFTVNLETDGSLTLRWKCQTNGTATGIFYQVQRKFTGESQYINIGGAPTKEFNDNTVPAGSGGVYYRVTGYRGTRAGAPSSQLFVQFGVAGPGGISVTGGTLAMAA